MICDLKNREKKMFLAKTVLVTWAEHVTISHFVIKIFFKKTTFVSSKFNAAFAQKQRVYCELWQYTSGQRLKVRWHVNFPAYFIQSCQNCWAATSLSNVLCVCFCCNIFSFFLLIRIFFRLSQVNELTAFLTSKLPLRGELCSLRFYLCTKLIYA